MDLKALQAHYNANGVGRVVGRRTSARTVSLGGKHVAIIDDDPGELADDAGLSRDTYALARCLSSEGYGDSDEAANRIGIACAQVAIGQALINRARVRKVSMEELITTSVYSPADGLYGSQVGRIASSALDPTEWSVRVATGCLASEWRDLVGSSWQWDSPINQDRHLQGGNKIEGAIQLFRRWDAEDRQSFIGRDQIPTVDDYIVAFTRREADAGVRASRLADFEDMVTRARAGDHGPAPGDPDGRRDAGNLLAVAALIILRKVGLV